MTYALREVRALAAHALAALIPREIARIALAALGISVDPVHEPVHGRDPYSSEVLDVARGYKHLDRLAAPMPSMAQGQLQLMARRSSSRIRAAQALRFEGLRSTELPTITASRRRRYSSIDGKESIQSVENRSFLDSYAECGGEWVFCGGLVGDSMS